MTKPPNIAQAAGVWHDAIRGMVRPMDNGERRLNEAFRELADDDRSLNASVRTERAVMAQWDAAGRAHGGTDALVQEPTGRRVSWIAGAAAAAVLAIAIATMSRPAQPPETPPAAVAEVAPDPVVVDRRPESNRFFPLAPITQRELNGSSLQLMRVQLRGAQLSRLGVEVDELRGSEVIEADVLLGEDGIARAIRFER